MPRLTLELTNPVAERLDGLVKKTEAASKTEVFRRALALYELVVDYDATGGSVLVTDKEGESTRVRFL